MKLPVESAALLLAWGIDALVGEPRDRWHPVAWFGRPMQWLGVRLTRCTPVAAFVLGALCWIGAVAGVALLGVWIERLASGMPWALRVIVLAVALKPCFAWRMLRDEVLACDRDPSRAARLVSRDTRAFRAGQLRGAALASLAENLNDSVIAPVLCFVIGGLPLAMAYRAVNTLDALWGYRDHREYSGKFAARADDLFNLLPSRLTAALLAIAHAVVPRWGSPRWDALRWRYLRWGSLRWRPVQRDARSTPSPNGGWPMAVLAHAVDTRLEKPGVYVLNADAPEPDTSALQRGVCLATAAALLALLLAVFTLVALEFRTAA